MVVRNCVEIWQRDKTKNYVIFAFAWFFAIWVPKDGLLLLKRLPDKMIKPMFLKLADIIKKPKMKQNFSAVNIHEAGIQEIQL